MISKENKNSISGATMGEDTLVDQAAVSSSECLRGIIYLNPRVKTVYCPKTGPQLTWSDSMPKDFGFIKRLIFKSPPQRHICLDQIGSRTIELIDGHNSVDDVATTLTTEFGLELNKTRAALLIFLTQLMRKNLITVIEP